MNTAQVFKTSVTVNNNSSIQDYEVTRGFKPFTVCTLTMKCVGWLFPKELHFLGTLKLSLSLFFLAIIYLYIYFYIYLIIAEHMRHTNNPR